MQLYPHNQTAYENVMQSFQTNNRAAIVHATGTGKSLVAAEASKHFSKVLVLAPNNFVLGETQKWCGNNCTFRTYASNMYEQLVGFDLIILDEFHRAGAPEWGKGVKKLIEQNPSAKLLGLSATNIRYLDGERNMADELFEGNVVSELTLSDAINRGILPNPTYVSSIYDVEKDYDELKSRIEHCRKKSLDKKADIEKLARITRMWKEAKGVPYIIRKYYTNDMRRIIVFTSQVGHFDETRKMLANWFVSAGYKHLDFYRINYTEPNVEGEMARFQDDSQFERESNPVDLKIAISVDMLNEGVHIPRVDGIIMLRGTISRIIIEQQVGRCLTANNNGRTPVVLDLVNNMDSIRYGSVDYASEGGEYIRHEGEVEDAFPFRVIDECKDIREFYQQMNQLYAVQRVEGDFTELLLNVLDYCKTYHKAPPKSLKGEFHDVSCTYAYARARYNRGDLEGRDLEIMQEILAITDHPLVERLDNVVEFCKTNHRVPNKTKDKGVSIDYSFALRKRKNGTITDAENAKLEEALSYVRDLVWDEMRPKLEEHYKKYGHLPTPTEDEVLYRFVNTLKKRKNLSQERKDWLSEHGYRFDKTIRRTPQELYDIAYDAIYKNDFKMVVYNKESDESRMVYDIIGNVFKWVRGSNGFPKGASKELKEKVIKLYNKTTFAYDIEKRLSVIEKMVEDSGASVVPSNSKDRTWILKKLNGGEFSAEQKERALKLINRTQYTPSKIVENSALVAWIKENGRLPRPNDEERRVYNSMMKFRKCKNGRYPAIEKDPETYAFLQTYGFTCQAKEKDKRPLQERLQEMVDYIDANGCLNEYIRNRYYTYLDRHKDESEYKEFFAKVESVLDKSKCNKGREWTAEEDAIIMQHYKRNGQYVDELMKLIPNRSRNSLLQRGAVLYNKQNKDK